MNTADRQSAFRAMSRCDPDGWESTEPTDLDRAQFAQWATKRYGADILKAYLKGEAGYGDDVV